MRRKAIKMANQSLLLRRRVGKCRCQCSTRNLLRCSSVTGSHPSHLIQRWHHSSNTTECSIRHATARRITVTTTTTPWNHLWRQTFNSAVQVWRQKIKVTFLWKERKTYYLLVTHWHWLLHSTSTCTPPRWALWLLTLLHHWHDKIWHRSNTRSHSRNHMLLETKSRLQKESILKFIIQVRKK